MPTFISTNKGDAPPNSKRGVNSISVMKSLSLTLEDIKKSGKSLSEKKELCIKIGLRPRDIEYLEFTGFFNEKSLTFGVEIECNVRRGEVEHFATPAFNYCYEHYNHTDNRSYYKFVTDGSVRGESPIECVSPILDDTADGFKSLQNALQVLNRAGASVNRTCGLHVHVGVSDYSTSEIVSIYKNYQRLERVIDSFMAPSRRGNEAYYAQSITGYDFDTCNSTDDIVRLLGGRYFKVNPMAYGRHRTIEFRQHQGSVDYNKISMWVKFCCKLVEWSKKHTLECEVTTIEEVPFINEEEKRFFKGRIAYFASL